MSAFHVGEYARSVFHARVECEEMVGVGRNIEQTKKRSNYRDAISRGSNIKSLSIGSEGRAGMFHG